MKIIFLLFLLISFIFSSPIPLSWSSSVSVTSMFDLQTSMFDGMLYINHANETSYLASSGNVATGFNNPINVTQVDICNSESIYWTEYENGTCNVGCCGGQDFVSFNSFFRNNRDDCACGIYPIFIFSLAKEVGNCSRMERNGVLHQFTQQNSDLDLTISICMADTPIFYHETILHYPSYVEDIIDITFITFEEGITNPSIFDIPTQCDCNI